MTTQLTQPSDEALVMLEALGRTLEKALDQQARIGRCALVWKEVCLISSGQMPPHQ